MPETQNGTRALLEEIIAEARKLLTDYDEYLRGNETATRALVIDRVLTALGWDIKDPAPGSAGVSLQRQQGGLRSPVFVRQIHCHCGGKVCGFGPERNRSETGLGIRNRDWCPASQC